MFYRDITESTDDNAWPDDGNIVSGAPQGEYKIIQVLEPCILAGFWLVEMAVWNIHNMWYL